MIHAIISAFIFCAVNADNAAEEQGRNGMIKGLFILALIAATSISVPLQASSAAPVGLRVNTAHGLSNAKGAVLDAGLKLSTEVAVTASSQADGAPFLPPDKLLADAKSVGATIISSSFSGWQAAFDSLGYMPLTANKMVHVYAYEPVKKQPKNVPPPAAFVTVNKTGGKSGDGIEFGVPAAYMNGKGQSSTPSGATAQLAGLMACLKYQHPSWSWFDVKAALRSTAANYATGYDPDRYGYGSIDYYRANAVTDAAQLPLFAPAAVPFFTKEQKEGRINFFINSFKQTRRMTDALFKFTAPPKVYLQELTLPEITALGGTWVFSGDLSKTKNIHTYNAGSTETIYFVWFTVDLDGNYSRIEPYSIIGPVRLFVSGS